MLRKSFIKLLFSLFIIGGGPTLALAEKTSTTTVEFSSVIHFLNPAGEGVEVGPGVYQVEAAESWLKLVPEGQGRTEAVLLEAVIGIHDETVTEPTVRLEREPENQDVFHLAMLLADGTGLEAMGTASGIRPRGMYLSYLKRPTRKPSTRISRFGLTRPKVGSGKQAPVAGPTGQPVDCGPFIKQVERHQYAHNSAIAVYNNKLHVVYAMKHGKFHRFIHKVFDGKEWKHILDGKANSEGGLASILARKGTHAALAVFQNRLHMVYSSGRLGHTYFDGQKWSRVEGIVGQKSRATPALVVFRKQLHMVHLGDTAFDIWHSIYKEKGWTLNQKIGIKSGGTPALAVFGNRIHMVTTRLPQSGLFRGAKYLYHSQFDGSRWTSRVKIPRQLSKAIPALVSRGARLHLIHLGNTSDQLWYSLYGWRQTQGKKGGYTWFGEKKLSGLKSDSLVGVVFHEGCMHMASRVGTGDYQDRQEIRHTTFPPRLK